MKLQRILYLTHCPPFPPTTGGCQRSNLTFRALSEIAPTDLVLVVKGRLEAERQEELKRNFGLIGEVSFNRGEWPAAKRFLWRIARIGRLRDLIDDWYAVQEGQARALSRLINQSRYDVLYGLTLRPIVQTGAARLQPLVVDVDDLDTDVIKSRLAWAHTSWPERVLLGVYMRRLSPRLQEYLSHCDCLLVSNRNNLQKMGRSRVVHLPNIPFGAMNHGCLPVAAGRPSSPHVLFVGGLGWGPNTEAIDHFVRQIWPKVHRDVPDALFHIVGSGGSPAFLNRWAAQPNVKVVGFVDDVSLAYERAAFSVAPLYRGAGTSIKILESLFYGRTVVATPQALRGYEADLGLMDVVCVAHSDVEFAQSCVLLLQQPDLCLGLAMRGAAIVAERYSWDRFRAAIREALERVGPDFRRDGLGLAIRSAP